MEAWSEAQGPQSKLAPGAATLAGVWQEDGRNRERFI